ncbi:MAG TPA: hypothetical protein VF089_11465 [Candidatus Binatia bacterium]
MAVALLLVALAVNLQTYQRLMSEQEVAELAFQAWGSQHYQVHLQYPSGQMLLSICAATSGNWTRTF